MAIIAFKPVKARLVIEQGRESVVVMKVLVAKGETVALASGGRLESVQGSLRIRERKEERGRGEAKAVGSLVYVDAAGQGEDRTPASFQINISLSPAKFDALLKVAISDDFRRSSMCTPASAYPRRKRAGWATRCARASA
jgi:hypothetical protein